MLARVKCLPGLVVIISFYLREEEVNVRVVAFSGVCLMICVSAAFLPVWGYHAALTPSGLEGHDHTLFEIGHVH